MVNGDQGSCNYVHNTNVILKIGKQEEVLMVVNWSKKVYEIIRETHTQNYFSNQTTMTPNASSFHDGSFLNLIPFFVGGVFCLFTILPLLQYSLKNHHSETMAVMTGILAGSLKTLWPLKSNYDIHQGPLVNTTFNNADFSNESLLFISLFIIFGFLIENLIIYLKKSTVLLNK